MEFKEFGKIARLSRECVITEKIDGTNSCIHIGENGEFLTGSRKRWITPEDDNYGFSRWAHDNKEDLMKLGVGTHFGEWWGKGIQKRYTIQDRRFYLFNTGRWNDENKPACCGIVPVLFQGIFSGEAVNRSMQYLELHGSMADPDCKRPEGIIIYHTAADIYFKKTLEKDSEWKGKSLDNPEDNN